MSRALKYEYYSTVRPTKVDWLWYPYIPYGKLTVVQGDPGEGKSTFMINIAALVTKGLPMPDGSTLSAPQTVVYQCAEDDVSDTVKPRLEAAGADCNRIAYIVDNADLTMEDDRIVRVLKETGARLLILDPIQAFLAQDGDMQSAGRMRSVLGRLAELAGQFNCAIVLIGHLNKGNGGKSLYRGLGTIDIAAIARSVLLIGRCSSQVVQRRDLTRIQGTIRSRRCHCYFLLGENDGCANGNTNKKHKSDQNGNLLFHDNSSSGKIFGVMPHNGRYHITLYGQMQLIYTKNAKSGVILRN